MLFLYSKTINSFLSRLYAEAREILEREVGISVGRRRFLWQGYYYPLQIVIFERNNELGYFDPDSYQIGIHRHLLHSATPTVLKNILRHELAHFLTYLVAGKTDRSHGVEFHQTCKRYGWGSDVSLATGNIAQENQNGQTPLEVTKILAKVQKLLKLGDSSNGHEAELATSMANELLIKYNLQYLNKEYESDEVVYVARVLEAKRYSGKWRAIYKILQHFYVQPVVSQAHNKTYLEVVGDQLNVEMADYIAKFLNNELDLQWTQAKINNPKLKGLAKKNSFFRGLAEGFTEKLKASKKSFESFRNELITLENNLQRKVQLAYPRLGSSSSQLKQCSEATQIGKLAGKNLSINPAIKNDSAKTRLLGH